jgi:hypothetical protein
MPRMSCWLTMARPSTSMRSFAYFEGLRVTTLLRKGGVATRICVETSYPRVVVISAKLLNDARFPDGVPLTMFMQYQRPKSALLIVALAGQIDAAVVAPAEVLSPSLEEVKAAVMRCLAERADMR